MDEDWTKSHPARSRSEKAKPRIPFCKVTNARRCLDFDNNETHDGRNARNLAERMRTSAILELWNYKWFMGNCLTPSRLQGLLEEPQGEGEKKNCLLTDATKETLMAIEFSRNKTPFKSLKPYSILWIKWLVTTWNGFSLSLNFAWFLAKRVLVTKVNILALASSSDDWSDLVTRLCKLSRDSACSWLKYCCDDCVLIMKRSVSSWETWIFFLDA